MIGARQTAHNAIVTLYRLFDVESLLSLPGVSSKRLEAPLMMPSSCLAYAANQQKTQFFGESHGKIPVEARPRLIVHRPKIW
jgi:hypothetical protein